MSWESDSIMHMFRQTGALLSGHFRLTSGRHSAEYLQCAKVLQYPDYAGMLGRHLADNLQAQGHVTKPDLVVSPAIGGLIIGHEVARALEARFLFTERGPDSKMVLRRGFELTAGETAVVVEDVITTGGSTREVVELLQAAGVKVMAAGSIIDRSAGAADVGAPRVALATLQVESFAPEECPLCKRGEPVVKPGSRPS